MLIIKKENLDEAVELLKKGKVLIFPTETSYGLGCDAVSQSAVDRIFEIKLRQRGKPLLVVVGSVEMAKRYLVWNDLLDELARKYWPGPLTIVGEYRRPNNELRIMNSELAYGVVSEGGTVAMRVTNHPIIKKLSEDLGHPIVATSANIAGGGDIYSVREIKKVFARPAKAVARSAIKPDAIFDGGDLPVRPPTTVASVVGGKLEILRQGELET